MARRRDGGGGGGDDAGTWLNTYADMVTLLLTFFAVMLSMSSVSEEKFNAFVEALQGKVPNDIIDTNMDGTGSNGELDATNVGTFDDLFDELKSYVEGAGIGGDVTLSKQDDAIYIRFNSSTFFMPDSYKLRESSLPELSVISDSLKAFESRIKMINICGHTALVDNENYGVSSWMLSGERAASVAIYLDKQKDFDTMKMMSIGYGSNYPIADNDTTQGKKENRRVELMIISTESGLELSNYDTLKAYFDNNQYPATGGVTDVLVPGDNKGTNSGTPQTNTPAPPANVEMDVSPFDETT